MTRALLAFVAISSLAATACSGSGATTTTTTIPATTTTAAPQLPPSIDGWDTTEITIAAPGEEAPSMLVAVADDEEEREQGLMHVTDLVDIDGMLFIFPGDTEIGFWMKNTLIPLDIAFFAADGALVDVLTMEPCPADPCPVYHPSGPYRFAVEAVESTFGALAGPEVLVIDE